jgi:hypothetical protein
MERSWGSERIGDDLCHVVCVGSCLGKSIHADYELSPGLVGMGGRMAFSAVDEGNGHISVGVRIQPAQPSPRPRSTRRASGTACPSRTTSPAESTSRIHCFGLLQAIVPTSIKIVRDLLWSQCDPGHPDDFVPLQTVD